MIYKTQVNGQTFKCSPKSNSYIQLISLQLVKKFILPFHLSQLKEVIPYRALISGEAGSIEPTCRCAGLIGEGHHIEDAQTRLRRT